MHRYMQPGYVIQGIHILQITFLDLVGVKPVLVLVLLTRAIISKTMIKMKMELIRYVYLHWISTGWKLTKIQASAASKYYWGSALPASLGILQLYVWLF